MPLLRFFATGQKDQLCIRYHAVEIQPLCAAEAFKANT
jgi:hypothetical protein